MRTRTAIAILLTGTLYMLIWFSQLHKRLETKSDLQDWNQIESQLETVRYEPWVLISTAGILCFAWWFSIGPGRKNLLRGERIMIGLSALVGTMLFAYILIVRLFGAFSP
jgi:hypothetical protein